MEYGIVETWNCGRNVAEFLANGLRIECVFGERIETRNENVSTNGFDFVDDARFRGEKHVVD